MSLADLNSKINMDRPGFVKEEVKKWGKMNPKKAAAHRARVRGKIQAVKLVKIPQVVRLLDLLNGNDLTGAVQVWREGMKATRKVWDPIKRERIPEPDWHAREQFSKIVVAYLHGLPEQVQIQLQGKFTDLGEILAQVKESPETMKMLAKLGQPVIDVESEGA